MTKVSVIIPVLETAEYLKECIDSILQQDIKDVTVLCVGIASHDSLRVLDSYSRMDARVRMLKEVVCNKNTARNLGIEKADSEYVCFMDQCDFYPSDSILSYLYDKACENTVDMCGGEVADCQYDAAANTPSMEFIHNSTKFQREGMVTADNFQRDTGFHGFMYGLDFLKSHNITFPDYECFGSRVFFLKAVIAAQQFYIIDKICYARRRELGQSFPNKMAILDILEATRNNLETSRTCGLDTLHREIAERLWSNPIGLAIRHGFEKNDSEIGSGLLEVERAYSPSIGEVKKYRKLRRKYYLEQVFSIKNSFDRKYKVLTIFGKKINFYRYALEKGISLDDQPGDSHCFPPAKTALEYYLSDVPDHTILVVEPNDCHGEVIPGYVRYIRELGYNVHVLLLDSLNALNPMCFYDDKHVRKMTLSFEQLMLFLSSRHWLEQYEILFFTSHILYRWLGDNKSPTVFQYFPLLEKYRNKIITVEHHLDKVDPQLLETNAVLTLADFGKGAAVNPHYFGEIEHTKRNREWTNFIMVGAIEPERRNCGLLIDAVGKLLATDEKGFLITVIGRGQLAMLPEKMRKYFKILGSVDFPTMYSEVMKSDFFLPLLDPENKNHDRYLTYGTSGSFQLIYGFYKPSLMAHKFAAKHGFSEKNCILYEKNEELAQAMLKAINLQDTDYEKMRFAIKQLASEIYSKSIATMQDVMKHKEAEHAQ